MAAGLVPMAQANPADSPPGSSRRDTGTSWSREKAAERTIGAATVARTDGLNLRDGARSR